MPLSIPYNSFMYRCLCQESVISDEGSLVEEDASDDGRGESIYSSCRTKHPTFLATPLFDGS